MLRTVKSGHPRVDHLAIVHFQKVVVLDLKLDQALGHWEVRFER